ncbi:MAG: NAD-dependent epimerase/dehydratase family protein, partial [Conexivisphaerales archaeon]
MKALITGGAGLVGSETSRLLAQKGFEIISVDNFMRGRIFGPSGDTRKVMDRLHKDLNITHYEIDIRDDRLPELMKGVDLIVHTAAQPSHPRSIEIPEEDFDIN